MVSGIVSIPQENECFFSQYLAPLSIVNTRFKNGKLIYGTDARWTKGFKKINCIGGNVSGERVVGVKGVGFLNADNVETKLSQET